MDQETSHALACLDYLVEQALIGVNALGAGDAQDVEDNANAIRDLIIARAPDEGR